MDLGFLFAKTPSSHCILLTVDIVTNLPTYAFLKLVCIDLQKPYTLVNLPTYTNLFFAQYILYWSNPARKPCCAIAQKKVFPSAVLVEKVTPLDFWQTSLGFLLFNGHTTGTD